MEVCLKEQKECKYVRVKDYLYYFMTCKALFSAHSILYLFSEQIFFIPDIYQIVMNVWVTGNVSSIKIKSTMIKDKKGAPKQR